MWIVSLIVFHLSYKKVYFLHSDISELGRIGKEVLMAYFKVLPNNSLGVTEGKSSLMVICPVVEIQTGYHPYTSKNHYELIISTAQTV